MNTRNKTTATSLTSLAAVVLFGATTASAEGADELRFASELERCVAAVNEQLELSGADRVRHVVTHSGRSGIGYALTIRTSVFHGDSQSQYSSYCVANGDNEPTKFRITKS